MNTVNRNDFLVALELVQPGLSTREILEQSSCFVFKDGKVQTYNDEVACAVDCPVKGLEGAVQAVPLLGILRKLVETEVEVGIEGGELLVVGQRRRAGIRCDAEVLLPLDKVDRPGKWTKLPEAFVDGVGMVQHCATRDESRFELTCIHLNPEFLEACDNYQMTRVWMKTGLSVPVLVKRDSLKHIVSLGMSEFSETEGWIHFRNSNGVVLSCRRYLEKFPKIESLFNFEGHPIVIPKGLADAAVKAQVFSAENVDDDHVQVELRPGKLRIRGSGATGWYQEVKELVYKGPELAFMVAPELLVELTEKPNEARITDGRLKVEGENWVYCTCLSLPEEHRKETQAEEQPAKKKRGRKETPAEGAED